MIIEAICPASCGELLQGYIGGSEKLISYGINLFTKVTLIETFKKSNKVIPPNNKKAYSMLNKVFQYYGYKEEKNLFLKIESAIPIGKGMASSTADLTATAVAVAKYLGKTLSPLEIAKLCITIEPTDSIVFPQITLFDHLNGSFYKEYGEFPSCKVLVLEGKGVIDTIDFRKIDRSPLLKENEKQLKKALSYFEKGIKNQNLKDIGKGATISSFLNQRILYKEDLEEIYEIAYKLGAYGINVAHSGTVIGVLYNDKDFDKERFLNCLKEKNFSKHYLSINSYNILPAGGRLIT